MVSTSPLLILKTKYWWKSQYIFDATSTMFFTASDFQKRWQVLNSF